MKAIKCNICKKEIKVGEECYPAHSEVWHAKCDEGACIAVKTPKGFRWEEGDWFSDKEYFRMTE